MIRSSDDLPAPLAPEHADLGARVEGEADVLQHLLVRRVEPADLAHRVDELRADMGRRRYRRVDRAERPITRLVAGGLAAGRQRRAAHRHARSWMRSRRRRCRRRRTRRCPSRRTAACRATGWSPSAPRPRAPRSGRSTLVVTGEGESMTTVGLMAASYTEGCFVVVYIALRQPEVDAPERPLTARQGRRRRGLAGGRLAAGTHRRPWVTNRQSPTRNHD